MGKNFKDDYLDCGPVDKLLNKLENLSLDSHSSPAEVNELDHKTIDDTGKINRKKKSKKTKTAERVLVSNSKQTWPTFDSMNLDPKILQGLNLLGVETPSSVQQRAIVPLSGGRDAIIQGQSGMGKTVMFVIAALNRLMEINKNPPTTNSNSKFTRSTRPHILVLAPTRELALQIDSVFQLVGRNTGLFSNTCIGGTKIVQEMFRLEQGGIDILVGSPGRILDLVKRGKISVDQVKMFILDEADKMLETEIVGKRRREFKFDEIRQLFEMFKSKNVQKILTSATLPPGAVMKAQSYLTDPLVVLVKNEELTLEGIAQYYIKLQGGGWSSKVVTLLDMFEKLQGIPTIVFLNTRKDVERLGDIIFDELQNREKEKKGSSKEFAAIHGRMDQRTRERALRDFRAGRIRMLISTDLFGRGIDVQNVAVIINFDFPMDEEVYIHRVGRGGRYGRKGRAITFVNNESNEEKLKKFERFYTTQIGEMPVDAFHGL